MENGKVLEVTCGGFSILLRISILENEYITEITIEPPFEIKNCLAVPVSIQISDQLPNIEKLGEQLKQSRNWKALISDPSSQISAPRETCQLPPQHAKSLERFSTQKPLYIRIRIPGYQWSSNVQIYSKIAEAKALSDSLDRRRDKRLKCVESR